MGQISCSQHKSLFSGQNLTMKPVVLFEDESRFDLLPLAFTRPIQDLRIGIDTIIEKWQRFLPEHKIGSLTLPYLMPLFGKIFPGEECLFINACILPEQNWINTYINGLAPESGILDSNGKILAFKGIFPEEWVSGILISHENTNHLKLEKIQETPNMVLFPWDIFKNNATQIKADFEYFCNKGKSAVINDPHTIMYGKDNVFIEEGAKIKAAIINAESGPIYIGKNAEIQEGAILHGTHALCDHSVVNMGAKMRGDSTIGPYCKVGGEVSNSVFWGYSNKGHDGFLGNSVIGAWCNLGADTNSSNLKNNYAAVKVWNYPKKRFIDTGLQFCGLIMGDHSKCGINTMFNTGTVVGVSANIFGEGFPRTFIPSFAWGGANGFTTFELNKAFEVAERVMERRKKILTAEDKELLTHIFNSTSENRVWEKQNN